MLYALLRPLLFRLEPSGRTDSTLALFDAAHALGLTRLAAPRLPLAPVQVMGLTFPNPVGLAAGLDKNGEHIDALATLGFGFIEVGTVTPRPQPGNPRPRLFRIPQAQALINRMGFNNLGVDRLVHNVSRTHYRGILGINIGKNFDTPIERAAADYLAGMRKAYPLASYLAVNISSPNTQDLRQLQAADELGRLLAALKASSRRWSQRARRYVPLALKIAPDLTEEQIDAIAQSLLKHGDGRRDCDQHHGVARTAWRAAARRRSRRHERWPVARALHRGGARLHAALGERIPIIGVGGILRAEDARRKDSPPARR